MTAALATRLVPVLARDARRLRRRAALPAGAPAPRRVAVLRAVTAGALDRAIDVAATLEVRGFGARAAPPARAGGRGRATTSRSPPRRSRWPRSASRPPSSGWARVRGAPAARAPRSAARARCSPPRSPPARCCRSPTAGGSGGERARARRRHLRLSRASRARAARRDAERRAGRVRRARRRLGLGQVDAAARRRRAGAALPRRRRSPAGCACGGLDTREHGPGELAAVAGHAVPGPRDAGA